MLNIQPTITIAVASCNTAAAMLMRKSTHLFGFFELVFAPHKVEKDIKNVPKKKKIALLDPIDISNSIRVTADVQFKILVTRRKFFRVQNELF